MSGKQASCEGLSSAHSFPFCRTLMVVYSLFSRFTPFLLKWKPAVFIFFHTVYLQNLRLILLVVDLLVTVGDRTLIVTEMQSCNGPFSIAPTMKLCVVEVSIVFRLPACCVLQPFIYAFFNLSFTSPCTMFILPHLHTPFPAY